jgi:hypothetical protein
MKSCSRDGGAAFGVGRIPPARRAREHLCRLLDVKRSDIAIRAPADRHKSTASRSWSALAIQELAACRFGGLGTTGSIEDDDAFRAGHVRKGPYDCDLVGG